jgi:hypothetical protein
VLPTGIGTRALVHILHLAPRDFVQRTGPARSTPRACADCRPSPQMKRLLHCHQPLSASLSPAAAAEPIAIIRCMGVHMRGSALHARR